MKREEMVLEITNVVRNIFDLGGTAEEVADAVLFKILELGMLPPSKKLTYEEFASISYLIDARSQYREVHKWEDSGDKR